MFSGNGDRGKSFGNSLFIIFCTVCKKKKYYNRMAAPRLVNFYQTSEIKSSKRMKWQGMFSDKHC